MDRNVALIILDTVNKNYFDRYAPRLQSRSDCTFDQCKVTSSWSTPSHASILTGELLHKHGVQSNSQSFDNVDPGDTFLGDLSDYHRICTTYHNLLQPRYSFDKFFDIHRSTGWRRVSDNVEFGNGINSYVRFLSELLRSGSPYTFAKNVERGFWSIFEDKLLDFPYTKRPDAGASEITRITKKETDRGPEPFCLVMNYVDAHSPYRVNKHLDPDLYSAPETWEDQEFEVWEMEDNPEIDEKYTKNYRDLYGASIDYLDRRVSTLIDHIRQSSDRETTILITADHGHNLGHADENYLFSHGSSMSEGVVHVPLEIVNPPSGFRENVPDFFSQLDLRELIVRIAKGRSDIDDLTGRPVVAEHEGMASPATKFDKFPGNEKEFEYWNRMIRVLYEGDVKYEWDSLGEVKKFRIDSDRPCRQELIETGCEIPEAAEELFDVGIEEHKETVGMGELDPDVAKDLKDLGYL
ncbi:sulfatase-like hydrolase/transferase [Halorubrum sp. N11]|uniref:sulfatase-like hydrolase/transferase n=1 Tax=Halorubrum sp. N11 TaxID=3402276 RepID=UPI003EBA67D8